MDSNTHVKNTKYNVKANKRKSITTIDERIYTDEEASVEPIINVDVSQNGVQIIEPTTGFDSIKKVSITTSIPPTVITPTLRTKDVTITENGFTELTPETGSDGFDKVNILTAIPAENKDITITENGTTEVTPTEGLINKVNITTDVQPNLQKKTYYAATNGVKHIVADPGYDGISEAEVTVNVLPTHQTKNVTFNANGLFPVYPDEGIDCMDRVNVDVDVEMEDREVTITENGTTVIEPEEKDGIGQVTINTEIPLQNIKRDSVAHSFPISTGWDVIITPDEGYTAMKEVRFTCADRAMSKTVNVGKLRFPNTMQVTTSDEERANRFIYLSQVIIQPPNVEDKTVSVTSNESMLIEPSQYQDWLASVTLDVNVPQDQQDLFAFKNGTDVIYSHAVPSTDGSIKIEVPSSSGIIANTGAFEATKYKNAWKFTGYGTGYTTSTTPTNISGYTAYSEVSQSSIMSGGYVLESETLLLSTKGPSGVSGIKCMAMVAEGSTPATISRLTPTQAVLTYSGGSASGFTTSLNVYYQLYAKPSQITYNGVTYIRDDTSDVVLTNV